MSVSQSPLKIPMPSEFTLTWTELAAYFEHAAEMLGDYDPEPLLDRLRQLLADSVRTNFEGSHDPAGTPWAPLKHPRPGRKPLIRTGDLLHSAVEMAWHAVRTRDGLQFDGSLLPPYAVYHQFGTSTIPARPFFGISADFQRNAEELLARDVLRRMTAD